MGRIHDLWRYDGPSVVVTGCASGIGEHVARQLTELGAEVAGLDLRRPTLELKEFHEVDLADSVSIANVSSLAAAGYLEHQRSVAGLLNTRTFEEGIDWCHRHPGDLAGGGYR